MVGPRGRRDKMPRGRHTAGQRIVLVINCVVVLACLAGAAGLVIGKRAAEQSKRVAIVSVFEPSSTTPIAPDDTVSVTPTNAAPGTTVTLPPATPPPEPDSAQNFLVVGVDNDACIDPNSKYAGGIGHRSARLTDTIMVIRVDLATKRAAVLSFPRDLWVRVGTSMSRINTAYRNDDPSRLIATINNEFQIRVDHFIKVDFCAFMKIVDGVGGVTLPLPYAERDEDGLEVLDAGCHHFAGDEALAYVRSRHLEYRDSAGHWRKDLSSDLGRIARQQDFLRRTLTAARDHLLSPSVIGSLYDTYKKYLVIDDQLSISDIVELADVLRQVDSDAIRSYQFDVVNKYVNGQAVLFADLTPNMTAILDTFRGTSPLDAITPVVDTEATASSAATGATATAATAPVVVEPQPNAPANAIVPDAAEQC